MIFAGPSLFGVQINDQALDLRGPAQRGDVERAVEEGVTTIGLVDGHYEQVASVWHKEILYALSKGVAVYGASSMGALRAAECEYFGMQPVGEIARRYCTGELFDDADVAVINAPAELSYEPLSEPLVNALATISSLFSCELISADEAAKLEMSARAFFFADRTAERLVQAAISAERSKEVLAFYNDGHVDLKKRDALLLIETLATDRRAQKVAGWTFANSPFWRTRSSSVTNL